MSAIPMPKSLEEWVNHILETLDYESKEEQEEKGSFWAVGNWDYDGHPLKGVKIARVSLSDPPPTVVYTGQDREVVKALAGMWAEYPQTFNLIPRYFHSHHDKRPEIDINRAVPDHEYTYHIDRKSGLASTDYLVSVTTLENIAALRNPDGFILTIFPKRGDSFYLDPTLVDNAVRGGQFAKENELITPYVDGRSIIEVKDIKEDKRYHPDKPEDMIALARLLNVPIKPA